MDALTLQLFLLLALINLNLSIILPNIALDKPTYMSSTYSDNSVSSKAVDGLKTDLSYSGGQCAISASDQTTAELTVDIGDMSSITNISLFHRTENLPWNESNGHTTRFLGFSVYVSNTKNKKDGSICFHDNGYYNLSTIPVVLTLNCNLYGRYVIYYNERKQGQPPYYSSDAYIDMCEIEVYGCMRGNYWENCTKNCPANCENDICHVVSGNCFACDIGFGGPRCDLQCDGGMYGTECSLTCGACINNTQCHHINGSCLQGCNPGYQGIKCDEDCPFGKYGINCVFECSATCGSPNICNKTTGECVGGCLPGWKGFLCDQECDSGMYGPGCTLICGACINNQQCHHINGSCLQGCGPGYEGVKCDEECPFGKYGTNCRNTCSINCNISLNCNKTTGECVGGCQPGWKGLHCDQKCSLGTYGTNCGYQCGSCINQSYCHLVNGSCFGRCSPGYLGSRCDEECPFGKYGLSCKHNCSAACKSAYNCNITTGECVGGCQPGWKGLKCDQKCYNGTYGLECVNTCGNCIFGSHCHHVDGACLFGCAQGFQGTTCKEAIKQNEDSFIKTLAISTSVSISIVILGGAVNFAYWKRNRLKKGKQCEHVIHKSDSGRSELHQESAYTELGAVDRDTTYDDLHHVSEHKHP